jgi:hypothetical protein
MARRWIFVGILVLLIFGYVLVSARDDCAPGEWRINDTCSSVADVTFDDGWNTIEPGGETRCAHDTEFRFWLRPGNENLLVFFQGGGGCWDRETCRAGSSWYKQRVGSDALGYRNGIFDFDNPDNPFSDHTILFVPSCTGDVFMGAAVQDYGDDVVVYHHGFLNLQSALDFISEAAPKPESIFVTGCSAGSVGSAIAAPHLIEQYPETPVTQMGDSLGAIFYTGSDIASLWGSEEAIPEWIDTMPDATDFRINDYYIALAEHYPDFIFAQYNTRYDHVQQRYFGSREQVGQSLGGGMSRIDGAAENFHYFMAGGELHCITPRRQLYTYASGDVRLIDWVTALAAG